MTVWRRATRCFAAAAPGPEGRSCKAPTAGKIIALFAHFRRHRLRDGDRTIKTFWDPLSDAQRTVLELLDIPSSQFGAET